MTHDAILNKYCVTLSDGTQCEMHCIGDDACFRQLIRLYNKNGWPIPLQKVPRCKDDEATVKTAMDQNNDASKSEYGKFTDPRDGKAYKTVRIGEQVWLAENLNWEGAGVCYNEDPANGAKYGRLYTWEEAMKAVPPGWHLPADEEWEKLLDFAGGFPVAGLKLKAEYGWYYIGTDEFGFSAVSGGKLHCEEGRYFYGMGSNGCWWTATKYHYRNMRDDNNSNMLNSPFVVCSNVANEGDALSIRLVKD